MCPSTSERDYAPGGLRLERAAALLGEAGGLLAQGRENLVGELPRPWVEHAATQARRLARRLVAQAEWAPAARGAPAEAAWLGEAASYAADELEAYASWLEAERLPRASEEFALGAEGLAEWLRAAEGLDWAAGDLEATARERLQDDLAPLRPLRTRLDALRSRPRVPDRRAPRRRCWSR